jgi:hypothetical protein
MTITAVEVDGERIADGVAISDGIDAVMTDRPTHLAKCRECGQKMTFRPTSSGFGFTVVNHDNSDAEVSFGVSAAGLPMCPEGHGEMEIADDQIPVAEAFGHVAEQLAAGEAVQRSLPGIVPVFNYQGAYLELEAKTVEVQALHDQWAEDAETARESKKAWEKSAETLQKMGLEFRRRRREKAEGGTAEDPGITDSVKPCRFEQLHPGVPCPICTNDARRSASTVAPGSEEHGVEANQLLERQELEDCVAQLKDAEIYTTVDAMLAMKVDQMAEVQAWAQEFSDTPADEQPGLLESLPTPLASTHRAGPAEKENSAVDARLIQFCQTCGDQLFVFDDEQEEGIPVGWRVLVAHPCQGKAKEVGHRYPEKKAKKTSRKKRA